MKGNEGNKTERIMKERKKRGRKIKNKREIKRNKGQRFTDKDGNKTGGRKLMRENEG